ncbi:peroxisomal sarcosine oxidase-like [Asterias amurensis]|uniref:peroxisomal sarcosine oxidase-like n=1 Tax=Asterias amurensis TaxID=7602 RepID=UPI003AB1F552
MAGHMASTVVYDCIVVGGGIIGSGAAYQMAKEGHKTLLLEQFSLPHARGSSSGPSRIIRNAYAEDHHSAMVQEVQKTWEDIERETNTTLRRQTGMLVLNQRRNAESFVSTRQTLVKRQLPFEDLTTQQLTARYPLMSYEGHYDCLMDTEAGFLIANKCLQLLQDLFKKYGGTLHDGEKVTRIEPGRIVTVHTSKGQYKTGALVLAAGPWASELLKPLGLHLPLKVWKVNVCYFKEKVHGCYANYPIMIDEVGEGFVYCFPSQDYPGYMKFGYHLLWDEVDPDSRDKWTDKRQVDIDHLKSYVRKHYPGLESEPSIIEKCMYTCTPGEDIIIDTHPVHHNIAIGCGFSGKGFKMGPLIGKILGDLAMGKPPKYDIKPIRMNRFMNQKAKL